MRVLFDDYTALGAALGWCAVKQGRHTVLERNVDAAHTHVLAEVVLGHVRDDAARRVADEVWREHALPSRQ